MLSRYSEFNGRPFRFQQDLDLLGNLLDFVLAYGDEALRAMKQLEQDPEQSELLRQLLDEGLLEKLRGRFRLTPRAVNAMQRKALMEIFRHLQRSGREGHSCPAPGSADERTEGARPYEFGDPVSELDLAASLRNTLRRTAEARRAAGRIGRAGLLPLRFAERDLERHEAESRSSCSTVVLLDQSGSMARAKRYLHAKMCAMALIALIRQRFPFDTVDLVGFATAAEVVPEDKLPLLMPKPVTMFDPVIRMRVPLSRIAEAPPHFTNLHLGLLQAKRILQRRAGENKMIFIVTDGQPTAHVQGDYAHLLYPPSEQSHDATLQEAFQIARRGTRICTFALTDDYWDMDWLGFVDDLTRITRGVAFHCAGGDLSACVVESYLSGRRRRAHLA